MAASSQWDEASVLMTWDSHIPVNTPGPLIDLGQVRALASAEDSVFFPRVVVKINRANRHKYDLKITQACELEHGSSR